MLVKIVMEIHFTLLLFGFEMHRLCGFLIVLIDIMIVHVFLGSKGRSSSLQVTFVTWVVRQEECIELP